MKIKSLYFMAFILVFVGLFIACEDPTKPTPQYMVNFFANGGSPAPQSQTINQGGKVTEPAAMTKTGYGFGGWYMETDCINQWNFATNVIIDNISLYAKWDTIYFIVSFNANGGSPAPEQEIIAHGDKVPQPAYMTKTGYGFGGWYKEAACINQWNFAIDAVTGSIALYAKWDSNYYTVSFNADNGIPAPQQQDIAYNEKAREPPDLSKTGFTFGGWYKEAACINLWDFNVDKVIENITLYAKWIENFTVTFNATGGTPATVQQSIASGGKASKPDGIIKQDHAIEGWYKEEALINRWDFDVDIVTANITLYAKWVGAFTVTFNANGGTPATVQQVIASGGKASKPNNIIKQGYSVEGWYKEEALTNQWDFNTDTVTANITLYAKWIENFTVTFNADGGNPAPAQQSIPPGGKITMPPAMTKTGYTFGGWYKEAAHTNQWNFSTDIVTANITLYAKWIENFTVTFNADGGSPAPVQQSIAHGSKVIEPPVMSKSGYTFGGWYKEAAFNNLWNFNSDTVTQNIVLYAKWGYLVPPNTVNVPGTTLVQKLQWLASNAASNTNYLLEVSSDEFLNPHTLSYSGKSNITIQLTGTGGVKIIEIYGSGSLFTIENNVTLVLNENIVLKGKTNNNAPLVMVNSYGGNLIMNNGSKITGNTSNYNGGGGVSVYGTFTMNGGEISGNTASPYSSSYGGGGVYVSGTFTMNGGEISGNTVSPYSSSSSSYGGGGVYVSSGTFTMTGGEITGNTASYDGGGVYVSNGTFTMTGGEISDNTTSSYSYNSYSYGGGVYVNGTFTMHGGEITGNTASSYSYNSYTYSYGGGVYVNGTFTMHGGEITDNTASSSGYSSSGYSFYYFSYGGGVCVSDGSFTMTSGEISGNTATASHNNSSDYSMYLLYGGGVYVSSNSRLEKTGGIITGYSSDTVNGNVVKWNGDVQDNCGHAVYVDNTINSQLIRRRETTSGQGDNLRYIRNEPSPPTISGAWEE